MSLEVVNAGFLSLLQDYGRFGLQKYGVTNGGPLDEHAYLWANRLLGNHYNSPVLEVSFGGFSARFTKNTMMAICGADLSATLNGQALVSWQSYYVKKGDEIKFVSPKSGLRAYLAVKDGFLVRSQFNSCATVLREGLGGLRQDGKKIADKDILPYYPSDEETHRRVPETFIATYDKRIQLRFIPNYSATGSSESNIREFTGQSFKISQNIDRMGYRLEGSPIKGHLPGITSQGVSVGAIQLPKDGQPIVLMKDKQTMGGYPLLGCVAYLDIAKLAQGMPGTEVSFVAAEAESLGKELLRYKHFFRVDL